MTVNCTHCGTKLFECEAFYGAAAYCGEGCFMLHTGKPMPKPVKAKLVRSAD